MGAIVIIGAGESGVRAAFTLRELGYDGDVSLIGDEHLLPYERPPLSKGSVSTPKAIRVADDYAQSRIDLRLGTSVEKIDVAARRVWLNDRTSLDYDRLLIATGARPRLFPGMDGCLTLRSHGDAIRIAGLIRPGGRIGIIGGGFIGLELAATAVQAGASVTVIEAGPRLLARAVPEAIAAMVLARHRLEGVTVSTGASVSAADASTVTLADGSVLDFDLVVAGVGSIPNTELAAAGGLAVDNGVVVDSAFRTSSADVFAAGDCCSFAWLGRRIRLESWRAAQEQGAHAAAAMLGDIQDYAKVPWFWSDQYDLTLQVAGLFDMGQEVLSREMPDSMRLVFQLDGLGKLAAAAGIGPGNSIAKDMRLFEKLIERSVIIDPTQLADASFNLKSALKAA